MLGTRGGLPDVIETDVGVPCGPRKRRCLADPGHIAMAKDAPHPGEEGIFLTIPLELRSPMGLAVLGVIITSTPGTAWIDYNSARGTLLLHVFDLVDEQGWRMLIKQRYERLLLEIFQ